MPLWTPGGYRFAPESVFEYKQTNVKNIGYKNEYTTGHECTIKPDADVGAILEESMAEVLFAYAQADDVFCLFRPAALEGLNQDEPIVFGNDGDPEYESFLSRLREQRQLLGLFDAMLCAMESHSVIKLILPDAWQQIAEATRQPAVIKRGSDYFCHWHEVLVCAVDCASIFLDDMTPEKFKTGRAFVRKSNLTEWLTAENTAARRLWREYYQFAKPLPENTTVRRTVKRKRAPVGWKSPDEKRPEIYAHGPITGTLDSLSLQMKVSQRQVESRVTNKAVWGVRKMKGSYEIWFRTLGELQRCGGTSAPKDTNEG